MTEPFCKFSRRDFLRSASFSAAALAMSSSAPLAFTQIAEAYGGVVRGKEQLMVRSLRFLDLEMPMERLTSFITPERFFFVRNHVFEPSALTLNQWQLTVTGEVERPLRLRFRDLKQLMPAEVINTLECAGNGRTFFEPHAPGIQWAKGAVGTAKFSGPRLKDVLGRARLKRSARHVAFRGLDEAPDKVPQFIRSIPIEKALDPDTLLATRMNGETLSKHHGFPVRALVPGWIGAASCKWLTEIQVLDREFDGNFMKPGYRLPRNPIHAGEEIRAEDTQAITALPVKSIITSPIDGARVRLAPLRISGAAWAGEAHIKQVEVSADDGRTWQLAQLSLEHAKYAWRLWSYHWTPAAAGAATLLARATDSSGRSQPLTANWNPSGYLWNAADKVTIHAEG